MQKTNYSTALRLTAKYLQAQEKRAEYELGDRLIDLPKESWEKLAELDKQADGALMENLKSLRSQAVDRAKQFYANKDKHLETAKTYLGNPGYAALGGGLAGGALGGMSGVLGGGSAVGGAMRGGLAGAALGGGASLALNSETGEDAVDKQLVAVNRDLGVGSGGGGGKGGKPSLASRAWDTVTSPWTTGAVASVPVAGAGMNALGNVIEDRRPESLLKSINPANKNQIQRAIDLIEKQLVDTSAIPNMDDAHQKLTYVRNRLVSTINESLDTRVAEIKDLTSVVTRDPNANYRQGPISNYSKGHADELVQALRKGRGGGYRVFPDAGSMIADMKPGRTRSILGGLNNFGSTTRGFNPGKALPSKGGLIAGGLMMAPAGIQGGMSLIRNLIGSDTVGGTTTPEQQAEYLKSISQ